MSRSRAFLDDYKIWYIVMIAAALATIITIFALLFSLCLSDNTSDDGQQRFEVVESQDDWDVVYDKETKVMYTVSRAYKNEGNFTALLNSDGTPLLYEDTDVNTDNN